VESRWQDFSLRRDQPRYQPFLSRKTARAPEPVRADERLRVGFEKAPVGMAYVSPDGHWLAYMSNESGHYQVYVRPFPGPGGKWQISTGGGVFPEWSPNGREIFYRTLENKIMVAAYTATGDSFRAEKPRSWSDVQIFDLGYFERDFALHPDGGRIAVLKAPAEAQSGVTKVTFIFNFFHEIRRKFASSQP